MITKKHGNNETPWRKIMLLSAHKTSANGGGSGSGIKKHAVIVFIVIFCLCNLALFLSLFGHKSTGAVIFLSRPDIFGQFDEENLAEPNELDGCYHVYLDVGSNIGVQVRKLFQPELYKNATLVPIFEEYFGEPDIRHQTGYVCAVGFEPNPKHVTVLRGIEKAYKKCGWRAKFHTKTAVAHTYGMTTFFTDSDEAQNEWGGSIIKSKTAADPAGITKMIRLSDYILNKVVTRQLPSDLSFSQVDRRPTTVMKLDVEGTELEVMTDLVVTGALQHIDLAFVEYHPHSFDEDDIRSDYIVGLQKAVDTINYLSHKLRLSEAYNVLSFDDESYFNVTMPLPQCQD